MTMEFALQDNEIHLHYIDGSLHLVQDGWTQPITTTRPQMIEFMTTSESAIIEYISLQNFNDEVIFKRIIDNRENSNILSNSVEYWVFFWDFCCPFIKKGYINAILQSIIVSVPLFCFFRFQRYVDVFLQIAIYLSQSTG